MNAGNLIYISPKRKGYCATPKQRAASNRNYLLFRLKGIILLPYHSIVTEEEKELLTEAQKLIDKVKDNYTANSIKLGFNAKHRCYYCGRVAEIESTASKGDYLCNACYSR